MITEFHIRNYYCKSLSSNVIVEFLVATHALPALQNTVAINGDYKNETLLKKKGNILATLLQGLFRKLKDFFFLLQCDKHQFFKNFWTENDIMI